MTLHAPESFGPAGPLRLDLTSLLALGVAFVSLSLVVYAPAIEGPFLSDDHSVIVQNPWIHDLSPENLGGLLDPFGAATRATASYAPVHLLAHALEVRLFGEDTRGYHVVNIVLHALCSALLVAVLVRSEVPRAAAILAGALFCVHPANVEAVAWISRLETSLALALALLALLWRVERPVAATAAFGLALLTKATAAFALPVAALWLWLRPPSPARATRAWIGAGVWLALFVGFAIVEFEAFAHAGEFRPANVPTPAERLLWLPYTLGRYAVLGLTSLGASSFHQPPPPGAASPWVWLGGLVLGLGAWRARVVLRRREMEGLFWVWAAVCFAPVSQVVPFQFPIADRHLYFMLPGILGVAGCWLASTFVSTREVIRGGGLRAAPLGGGLVALAALVLLMGFGAHAHARARVWSSGAALLVDSARHYPEGAQGQLLLATRRARAGDTEAALQALEKAAAGGFSDAAQLAADPNFATLRTEPRFQQLISRIAQSWIDRFGETDRASRSALEKLAAAHALRGEYTAARAALERAVALGGPGDTAALRAQILELRALERRRENGPGR